MTIPTDIDTTQSPAAAAVHPLMTIGDVTAIFDRHGLLNHYRMNFDPFDIATVLGGLEAENAALRSLIARMNELAMTGRWSGIQLSTEAAAELERERR